MTEISADDGALHTCADHHTRRNQDIDNFRAQLRKNDPCAQLRILSIAADEYRDRIAPLVHEIIVSGGNMSDLTWLTHASPAFIAIRWLEWAQSQMYDYWHTSQYQHAVEALQYRRVAEALGIAQRFDDIITVFASDHYTTDETHV